MRFSTGGRAWSRPSRKPRGLTPGGTIIRLVFVGLIGAALSGCQAISALWPDGLSGSRSAPGEAFCIEYEVLPADGQALTPELLEQTRMVIENRVNATGVAEPIVTTQDADRISVELPGLPAEDVEEVRGLIGTTGVLAFMPVPAALQGTVGEGPLPEGMADIEPLFTGVEIASAAVTEDPTTLEVVVDLQLKDTGARLFDEYAEQHYGEQFAIVLDDEVMSAPVIQATCFGGRAQISGGQGGFTVNEANRLVTVLKFGSLPLEIREVGQGTCGGVPVPVVETKVTGTIVLPEGAVLSEGATWRGRLADMSRVDAPAALIAEADGVTDPAMTEIPFEIPHAMDGVDPFASYTLRIRVDEAGGAMRHT